MVRLDFAVAGTEAVGAECHLAQELRRLSSAWPSHLAFSYTSNGVCTFCPVVWWLLTCLPQSEI